MTAPPALTDWENDYVKRLDLLLRNAQIKNAEFERMHHLIADVPNEAEMGLRFRSFVSDLYSVLDYICYLLHCHYVNKGNPSHTTETRNVKFPFQTSLKKFLKGDSTVDPEKSHEKKRREWTENQCKVIFGDLNDNNKDARQYFEKLINNIQPLMYVDAAGKPIQPDNNTTIEEDARSFSLLHFYRNNSIHRDLTHVYTSSGVLYVNFRTGERPFLPVDAEHPFPQDDCQEIQLCPGSWIEVPNLQKYHQNLGIEPTVPEPLLIVASRLLGFVKITRNNLLNQTFNVSPYNHDVRWAFDDGLIIDGKSYSWEEYDAILKRPVY